MQLWRLGTRVKDLGRGKWECGDMQRWVVDTDPYTVARYVLL
jgi:hypothetical protein